MAPHHPVPDWWFKCSSRTYTMISCLQPDPMGATALEWAMERYSFHGRGHNFLRHHLRKVPAHPTCQTTAQHWHGSQQPQDGLEIMCPSFLALGINTLGNIRRIQRGMKENQVWFPLCLWGKWPQDWYSLLPPMSLLLTLSPFSLSLQGLQSHDWPVWITGYLYLEHILL